MTDRARLFLDGLLEEEYDEKAPRRLVPSLCTTYSRTTFVDLAGGCRLTCDVDLVCRAHTTRITPRTHVLVESKSSGAGGVADRLLGELGVRPVSVSKYCVAVALLYPHLPANPWHRVLLRHFGYGEVRLDASQLGCTGGPSSADEHGHAARSREASNGLHHRPISASHAYLNPWTAAWTARPDR